MGRTIRKTAAALCGGGTYVTYSLGYGYAYLVHLISHPWYKMADTVPRTYYRLAVAMFGMCGFTISLMCSLFSWVTLLFLALFCEDHSTLESTFFAMGAFSLWAFIGMVTTPDKDKVKRIIQGD